VSHPTDPTPIAARSSTAAGRLEDTVTTAMRGFFGRDSLYLVLWGLQLVGAAALTPVITRITGAPEFGLVAAANAVTQLLFIIAGLGLNTAIQRHHAMPGGATAAAKLLMLSLVLAVVVTGAVDSTGRIWSPYLGFDHYGGPVRLAVFWAGVSAATYATLAILRSQDRLLAFSAVGLLQSVGAEVLSLVLLVTVESTATIYLLGHLAAQTAALALGLVLTPPGSLRWADRALARTALGFALPLVPAGLSTFVLTGSDRLILHDQLGATAVARYQIASNIGSIPILLLSVLSTAWLPRIFAVAGERERTAVLAASRDALYRLLAPAMLGLSLGAPLLLAVWAPPSYRANTLVLTTAVVVVTTVPYTAGLCTTWALLAAGNTGTIAVATAIAAGTNVVLNLLLIRHFGLLGSPMATFVAYTVLYGLVAWRQHRWRPARMAPVGLIGLLGSAAGAVLVSALPTTPVVLAARAFLVGLCVLWFGQILLRLNTGNSGSVGFPRIGKRY
jgi:O-antigen/teichoic acid export membrane protein